MTQNNILSEMQQKEWSHFCEKLNKFDLTKGMTPGLNFIYEHLDDSVALNEVYQSAIFYVRVETVEIMAPLFDNPNAPDKDGKTPIYWAAKKGHTEIVKILAPLTDNPNAPNDIGRTPNQRGITPLAVAKNTEIREILKTYIK